jgi:protein-S-isoprenylcysteine O-methyltransferase Ste14
MFGNVHEIINVIWLTLGAVWVLMAFRLKPSVRTVDFGSRSLQEIVLGCACVLLFTDSPHIDLLAARSLPAHAAVVGAGIALTAVGVAFAIVARLYLGRNWSSAPRIKRDHGLVRRGPYRLVRHPIYTGMLVASIGTAIAFGQLRHLFALLLLIIGFWLKARSEERLLLGEFGERYSAYRLDVRGAIIPYLL